MSSNSTQVDDVAIRVSNLSKIYQIYSKPQDRLKQSIYPRLKRMVGRRNSKPYYHEFSALSDVSFEVRRGDTLGIIGRNGAGKSTLLQIICGTLHPTMGEVAVNGRVAALLELGSGFNPEFTGRENVYMNASILGLANQDIDARFDQIAAFADIGEYIEQPVKTYSSGMYARLAFAVIAHVDADILIVDEALSVGDAVFTQKCMRFIRKFKQNGTLLFVSHDMASVQNLCEQAIWLSSGKVQQIGAASTVAENYLQDTLQQDYGDDFALEDIQCSEKDGDDNEKTQLAVDYASLMEVQDNLQEARGWKTGSAYINEVSLQKLDGSDAASFEGGEHVRMVVRAKAIESLDQPIIGFLWRDRLGQDLFGENTLPYSSMCPVRVNAGQDFKAEFQFRLPMLPNGQYTVNIALANGDLYEHVQHHWLHDALVVTVSSSRIRWGLVGIRFDKIHMGCDRA